MNVDTMETVRQVLGQIIDPETGLNIMRMDLIQDLTVDDAGRLTLTFRPSSPVCPMAYSLGNEIKKKLVVLDGVFDLFAAVGNIVCELLVHLDEFITIISNAVKPHVELAIVFAREVGSRRTPTSFSAAGTRTTLSASST